MGNVYHLSPELIKLEKDEQLLLMDGKTIIPLLVQEGKDLIKKYLYDLTLLKEEQAILDKYPDRNLFDAFVSHGILQQERKNGTTKNQSHSIFANYCHKSFDDKKERFSLYLLLTQYCNLGCIYCLNGDNTYRKKSLIRMQENIAFKAVEKGFSLLKRQGTLDIIFFGGEPLLNWQLIKKIIGFCESIIRNEFPDKNWNYHITTNLTIFPKDMLEYAHNYNIKFLINIDGPEDLHNLTRPALNPRINSFETTARNIKRLVKSGIHPALRTTVTNYNVDNMLDITKLHKAMGGSSSAFVPLIPVNSDEIILPKEMYPDPKRFGRNLKAILESDVWTLREQYPANEYIDRIQPNNKMKIACGAPFGNTPTIDANGDVYPCIYLVGINRYFIGNIFGSDFPYKNVLQNMIDFVDVDNNRDCYDCAYRYLCAGGCPVGKLTVKDNPNLSLDAFNYAREISCVISKTVIDHILWNLAENSILILDGNNSKTLNNNITCC